MHLRPKPPLSAGRQCLYHLGCAGIALWACPLWRATIIVCGIVVEIIIYLSA